MNPFLYYNESNIGGDFFMDKRERGSRRVGIGVLLLLFQLGQCLVQAVKKGELSAPWRADEPVIMLDAGHGGKDPGAGYGEVLEKDLTLELVKRTKELLKEAGYRVRLTRADDGYVEIHDRAEYARRKKPDLFVSIHCNSLEEGDANGIETFYAQAKGEASQNLAQSIQTNLIEATGARDRGAKTANYVVVKDTDMPAALVEVGFLSDAEERELLQQEEYQEKLAKGIVDGILAYCGE